MKEYEAGGKKFRFGGGEVLPSLKQVKFPAVLVNKKLCGKKSNSDVVVKMQYGSSGHSIGSS